MFSDHFAYYKRLQGGVYFVDSIPILPNEKRDRRSMVIQLGIELYKNKNVNSKKVVENIQTQSFLKFCIRHKKL